MVWEHVGYVERIPAGEYIFDVDERTTKGVLSGKHEIQNCSLSANFRFDGIQSNPVESIRQVRDNVYEVKLVDMYHFTVIKI